LIRTLKPTPRGRLFIMRAFGRLLPHLPQRHVKQDFGLLLQRHDRPWLRIWHASASTEHPPRLTYLLTFAHRFFAAADIFARAAADMRFFPALAGAAILPFNAWIAASTPASFLVSVARSAWSMFNRSVMGLLRIRNSGRL